MTRKVYSKQQAQDAAEAWQSWRVVAAESGESLGHPMPFLKLYTALMEKADGDRELLRWMYPDTPGSARLRVASLQNTLLEMMDFSDLQFSSAYIQFLLMEYTQRLSGRFTPISLQEQVSYPLVEGGGPLQLEEVGVVEGVVIDENRGQ